MADLGRLGGFSAVFADGALRDIRLLGHRALDGVYVAVRDPGWNTIPGSVRDVRVASDGFAASWYCHHRGSGIEFGWHGSVVAAGQELTFRMDGEAFSEFDTNRIGFCLLHPIELAGTAIEATAAGGERWTTAFPERISPGPILTGAAGLSYPVGPGVRVEIGFTGGSLETEDHRNWTDPGWKTYTPPLADPAPWRMRPGDRISQTLTLRGTTAPRARPLPPATQADELRIGPPEGAMPHLSIVFDPRARNLSRLAPNVLHVELTADSDWRALLAASANRAVALGCELSVALTGLSVALTGGDRTWLASCAQALAELRQPVAAVTVLAAADGIAPPGAAAIVRQRLPSVPVGGGSRLHFAELNRAANRDPDWDFVAFPVTPQVHHTDDVSVLATVRGQEAAGRDGAVLARGRPVRVGPVSLRQRIGPFSPASPSDPCDPRECGPGGVAWLCASVVAMHTAAAITFLNPACTTGVDAPDERGAGDECREFERVFAKLASLAGQPVLRVESDRRRIAALAVARGGRPPLLIAANLTPEPMTIRLDHRIWRLRGYEVLAQDG
jgi:D-apionolactonase